MMTDLRRNFLCFIFCFFVYNLHTSSALKDDDLNEIKIVTRDIEDEPENSTSGFFAEKAADKEEDEGLTSGQKTALGVSIPILCVVFAMLSLFIYAFQSDEKEFKVVRPKGARRDSYFNRRSEAPGTPIRLLPSDEDCVPSWRNSVRDSVYEDV